MKSGREKDTKLKKGEKSGSFNRSGKPVFSGAQVYKVPRHIPSPSAYRITGGISDRRKAVLPRPYTDNDYDYENPLQWDWGIVQ